MSKLTARIFTLAALAGLIGLLAGCATPKTANPPEHQRMRTIGSSSNRCGSFCGYIIYNNGLTPASGETMGIADIKAAGIPVPNANFHLVWRISGTNWDCASDKSDSSTQKTFPCAYPKRYFFTVYFKPGCCPPIGTDVALAVNFQ